LIYLKDGTVYDVSDYWLADGQVHYKTVDGAEGAFGVDQLDLQQTVDKNADRGVTFSLQPAPGNSNAAAPTDTLIYLKDGTVYDVTDYWLANERVYYKTANGGEYSFDLEQLDLEKTVNVNADRGVTFVLQPAPAPEAAPDATPNSAPAQPDATPNAAPDSATPPGNAPPPDATPPPPSNQ
jgi:predicted heme/steroid binding protein